MVALAPMAGVTDASYRQLIKMLAPSAIVYSEFLSTDALHFGARKTMRMLHFDPALERPFIVQVFGKKPEHFLSAAKVVEEMGADGIDINMGCPAGKVVSSCHGSALMRDPALAVELVRAVKEAVHIPVSVKTRLGWESSDALLSFCSKLVEAGADALAIHGRTYKQKFSGEANWAPIYELKKHVSVPVLGNGDIKTAADAVQKLQNLDGVMVGRGTFGNPWLLRDIVEAFAHASDGSALVPTIDRLTTHEKIPTMLQHAELAVRVKGEERGMREMRRHFCSYIKGFAGAAELRAKLVRVETLAEAKEILNSIQ